MRSVTPSQQYTYGTLKEAKVSINARSPEQGYAVQVRRTRKVGKRKAGDVKGEDLEFSQARAVIRDKIRASIRVSASRRAGCTFRVIIGKTRTYEANWKVTVIV